MSNTHHSMAGNDSDKLRWQAVLKRDAQTQDFVYAVLTTGIFCRSHCPSRRPRRDNVRFFNTASEARQAGYRACKRCRPEDASALTTTQVIAQACAEIKSASEVPSLKELSRRAGMSVHHFHRTFKAITGVTPNAFARSCRMHSVQCKLSDPHNTVTEAIVEAGFTSISGFYEQATAMLGMSPTQYRKGGLDARILFAVGECGLGSILVACTAKGVCCILLGDSPEPLLDDLQTRFPKAQLIGGDAQFEKLVGHVVGFIDRPDKSFELPLDIQGTAFQQRVWSALLKIPAGHTASYTDIAKSIGSASACRAVAGACAANHIAVAIPCHRVVRSDGALSGYRWGIERKRKLLECERMLSQG